MGDIQEHEFYANDDRLCYMLSLLINQGAKIQCSSNDEAEEFKENFEVFISETAETYIQTLSSQKQQQIANEIADSDIDLIPYQPNNWYEIEYSDKDKELSIVLKENGLQLDDTLRRYANIHWQDDLYTWNETNHYCSEKICREFYQEILDYNCKQYYLDNTKNITAIILGYYKGYVEIHSIECEIDLSPIGYMLFQPCYVNEYPTNLVTHFKCCVNANRFKKEFEELIKEGNSKSPKNEGSNKITKYPHQQQLIYDCIMKWLKNIGTYNIPPDELMQVLEITYKDTAVLYNAVSCFNKCYKEINNLDKPLIKKNRKTGYYEISKDFRI